MAGCKKDKFKNDPLQKAAKAKEPPKKMDQIFGPLRQAKATKVDPEFVQAEAVPDPEPEVTSSSSVFIDRDFDPNKKEVKGMSESVQLKKTAKAKKVEKPPVESKSDQRSKMFANMGKPAKFQKPKKPKEPTPPPKTGFLFVHPRVFNESRCVFFSQPPSPLQYFCGLEK